MARKILLVGALLITASPAYANDWYMINNNTNQCEEVQQFAANLGASLTTPGELKAYFEGAGETVNVVETKAPDGDKIIGMVMHDSDGSTLTAFPIFTSLHLCQGFLTYEEANGTKSIQKT